MAPLSLSYGRKGPSGRHPTNDLVLEDPRVSAVHLELTRRPGGHLLVRDVGSTNGTWIGENRIHEVDLAPGAILRLGDTSLRLEADLGVTPAQAAPVPRFEGLLGSTIAMRELFAVLERVASKALSLLVQGDTGTGKEEVARAVHARSARAKASLTVLDATTHSSDARRVGPLRTRARRVHGRRRALPGAFERAHGGTLFIDEVGELPLALQPKLLRVLERRELTRVGGKEVVPIDVRVVAATHRDLRLEIEAGRFREDLYFRLAQVSVVLPPLRERAQDVPELARHFLERAAEPGAEPGRDRRRRAGRARAATLSRQRSRAPQHSHPSRCALRRRVHPPP